MVQSIVSEFGAVASLCVRAVVSCEGLMQERTMAATEIARQAVRALFYYKNVLAVYQTLLVIGARYFFAGVTYNVSRIK